MPSLSENPVTFACTISVSRETVWFLSWLLRLRRRQLGTRAGRRALGPFAQAVLALRWFVDDTRMRPVGDRQPAMQAMGGDYTALLQGINASHLNPNLPEKIATNAGQVDRAAWRTDQARAR